MIFYLGPLLQCILYCNFLTGGGDTDKKVVARGNRPTGGNIGNLQLISQRQFFYRIVN
jgi:hypothetical protein